MCLFLIEDSNIADEQYLQIRTAICLDLGLVVMGHIISPPGAVRTLSLSSFGYKCKRVNTIYKVFCKLIVLCWNIGSGELQANNKVSIL